MKALSLFFFALFMTHIGFGQIVEVDDQIANEDLINTFLIGTGVVISNIEQYGANTQTGLAQTDSLNEFGFECAVAMSTGLLDQLEGPPYGTLGENTPTIYNDDM